ncbi:hypothetical protein CI610_03056 [invertebrate metagenome]|uniref:Uncharacterized protein n=1 Tax=invertebrate metagenome TaxID=1711999 RepID=A0A2H9T457_9ZZZZ
MYAKSHPHRNKVQKKYGKKVLKKHRKSMLFLTQFGTDIPTRFQIESKKVL